MRIAIAGYKDIVSGAWQLSQTLEVYMLDVAQGAVIPEGSHPFPGIQDAGPWLQERKVQAILVGTIDPDHADPIADKGIHVFTGAEEIAPEAIAGHFLAMLQGALLRGRGQGGCCGSHGGHEEEGCCGGHGHEGADEGGCCGGGGEDCCGGAGHDDPDHECRCR